MGNSNTKIIKVFTDGGSRGNPGPSGIGVSISDENNDTLAEIGKRIGFATNNVAEYSAIVEGLTWILENKNDFPMLSQIQFFMDSMLAESQLNGLYRIKNPDIRILAFRVRQLEAELKVPTTFSHVPREENKKADRLVNLALDNKI